jgi:hypothetical protein
VKQSADEMNNKNDRTRRIEVAILVMTSWL